MMKNMIYRPQNWRQGQAAVEYILVVSMLLMALFTGGDTWIFSALSAYFQGAAAILNLPIP